MNNKDLIFELIRRIHPRPLTKKIIEQAYNAGYESKSDGITAGGQFEFAGFKLKNPCGVGHDWLYFMGVKNPNILSLNGKCVSEYHAKRWADAWFRRAMYDFGYWAFAGLYWVALRCFSGGAWRSHRERNHPCPIDELPDVR